MAFTHGERFAAIQPQLKAGVECARICAGEKRQEIDAVERRQRGGVWCGGGECSRQNIERDRVKLRLRAVRAASHFGLNA